MGARSRLDHEKATGEREWRLALRAAEALAVAAVLGSVIKLVHHLKQQRPASSGTGDGYRPLTDEDLDETSQLTIVSGEVPEEPALILEAIDETSEHTHDLAS